MYQNCLNRLFAWVVVLGTVFCVGCGGDKDKGIYKDKRKDMPRSEKKSDQ